MFVLDLVTHCFLVTSPTGDEGNTLFRGFEKAQTLQHRASVLSL